MWLSYALALLISAPPGSAPRQVVLHDEPLVQSADGRGLLAYLISCALTADTRVVAHHADQRYEFQGGLGLAPDWESKPLSRSQQRRLSACMLARTNRFGHRVEISMRSKAPDAPLELNASRVSVAERERYAFFEGAFFGNLFATPARAYVCIGDTPTNRRHELERQKRECSLPDGDAGASPGTLSRCRMVIVGSCRAANYVQDGEDFGSDAIDVYLPTATTPVP
jgi:hypothetical protein